MSAEVIQRNFRVQHSNFKFKKLKTIRRPAVWESFRRLSKLFHFETLHVKKVGYIFIKSQMGMARGGER